MRKLRTLATILLVTCFLGALKYVSTTSQIEEVQNVSIGAAAYMASEGGGGFAAVAGGVGAIGSAAIYECAILAGAGPVGWACLGVVAL